MTRLFTAVVEVNRAHSIATGFEVILYECDFSGIHFSRTQETELIRWIRVCARHRYGKDAQVIFLHTEKAEQ